MRKIASLCCITISVVLGIFLNYVAYRVSQYSTDSKLASLIFVPTFIVIYWLGSFYEQLVIKDNRAIFKKKVRYFLRGVYILNMVAIIAVWLYVAYNYTYLFGNIKTYFE